MGGRRLVLARVDSSRLWSRARTSRRAPHTRGARVPTIADVACYISSSLHDERAEILRIEQVSTSFHPLQSLSDIYPYLPHWWTYGMQFVIVHIRYQILLVASLRPMISAEVCRVL
jgi:hypothetical protein